MLTYINQVLSVNVNTAGNCQDPEVLVELADMEEQVKGVTDQLHRCISFSAEDELHHSEVIREFRDLRPVHYLFKIENFSLLSNANSHKYESSDFEIGGYKWNLCVYPKGNKKVNEDNNKHISLYLILSNSNASTLHLEVNVYLKLFLYNHIQDKYLTIQDAKGRVTRFRGTKTERGVDQLLPLNVFNDPSNGYLIDDCCIFGAEVFVLKPINKGECASVVKELVNNNTYTWNIQNYVGLKQQEFCKSQVFVIGGYKWTLSLHPTGSGNVKGQFLSLFLHMGEALKPGHTLYGEFILRVKDQLSGKHHEQTASSRFHASSGGCGVPDLLPLSKLNDESSGYLTNSGIILEVQITLLALAKEFS